MVTGVELVRVFIPMWLEVFISFPYLALPVLQLSYSDALASGLDGVVMINQRNGISFTTRICGREFSGMK